MAENILIIGASTRAAAFSALRAGLNPSCLDRYADLDLRAVCSSVAVVSSLSPAGIAALARAAPPGPWMYTGGLENWPSFVRRLVRDRLLWGNGDGVLAKVRDPFKLHEALVRAGLPCPEVAPPGAQPTVGRWLVKPVAGSGGAGIRWAEGRRQAGPREYLQSFQSGESRSGVFVASAFQTRLLGVTRQLVGEPWLHAPPFRYCGSIGPLSVSASERTAWLRLGKAVAKFAGLRGLFGVDAIARDGVPWPVEVNPRYTASVEVMEYALGQPALLLHKAAFTDEVAPNLTSRYGTEDVVGKAVWYAPRRLTFPAEGPWSRVIENPGLVTEVPQFADIPAPGHEFQAGQPVLTFFARGENVGQCKTRLRTQAADLDVRLLA